MWRRRASGLQNEIPQRQTGLVATSRVVRGTGGGSTSGVNDRLKSKSMGSQASEKPSQGFSTELGIGLTLALVGQPARAVSVAEWGTCKRGLKSGSVIKKTHKLGVSTAVGFKAGVIESLELTKPVVWSAS